MTRLPLYVLLRPLLVGRDVLELGPSSRTGLEQALAARPRRLIHCADPADDYGIQDAPLSIGAGVTEWLVPATGEPPLPLPDSSLDVVLGPRLLHRQPTDQRMPWLAEIARLLRPDGIVALAVENAPGAADYYETVERMRAYFGEVVAVAQSPMSGVYLSQVEPPCAAVELSLVDDLAPEPEEASLYLLLAGRQLPAIDSYLLVSLPPGQPPAAPPPPQPRSGQRRATDPASRRIGDELGGEVQRLTEINRQLQQALATERATVQQRPQPVSDPAATQLGRLEGDLDTRRERHAALTGERDRLREELLGEQERRARLEGHLQQLNDDRRQLEAQLAGAEEELSAVRAEEATHRELLDRSRRLTADERAQHLAFERMLNTVTEERDQLRDLLRQQTKLIGERLEALTSELTARGGQAALAAARQAASPASLSGPPQPPPSARLTPSKLSVGGRGRQAARGRERRRTTGRRRTERQAESPRRRRR